MSLFVVRDNETEFFLSVVNITSTKDTTECTKEPSDAIQFYDFFEAEAMANFMNLMNATDNYVAKSLDAPHD